MQLIIILLVVDANFPERPGLHVIAVDPKPHTAPDKLVA